MTDHSDHEWPREIWAFAIDHTNFEPNGTYATSEHATIPRWQGDPERDRPVQRYVDADIYEIADKYWRARVETLEQHLETAHREAILRAAEILAPAQNSKGGLWAQRKERLREEVLALTQQPDVLATSGAEAQWIEDCENACPACGGSGHKDDAEPIMKLLREAHAVMRATEWHLAPASAVGDGVLEAAAADIEARLPRFRRNDRC